MERATNREKNGLPALCIFCDDSRLRRGSFLRFCSPVICWQCSICGGEFTAEHIRKNKRAKLA
jgi:hypothetical protein